MRHEKVVKITSMRQNITLNLSHEEAKLLRCLTFTPNEVARLALAVDKLRRGVVKNRSDLDDCLGRSEHRMRLRGVLVASGILSIGEKYNPTKQGKLLTFTETEEFNTFTEHDAEYVHLTKIRNDEVLAEERRIRKVQNLDGITLDVKPSTIIDEIFDLMEIEKELDRVEDRDEWKDCNYKISALQHILKNKHPKVQVYKKKNCSRLYSDLTNLPSKYRPNLKSKNGEYFVAVDITASQPRLFTRALTMLLNNEFDAWIFAKKILKIEDTKSFLSIKDEVNVKFEEWKKLVLAEMVRFDELLIGDFYSNVAKLVNSDRDSIKSEFMFLANDYSRKRKGFYYFKKFVRVNYPELHRFINAVKDQDMYHRANSPFNKKKFSIFVKMSKIESELILTNTVSKFIANNKDANIFTIHDSIAVEKKYIPEIVSLLKDSYKEANIPLSIKIEEYQTGRIIKEELEIQIYIEDTKENLIESKDKFSFSSLYPTNQCCTIPLSGTTSPVQKVLDRPTYMRLDSKNNRMVCSVKNKPYAQRKNETLEQFQSRVYQETGTTVKMKEN